ncbi:carbohydrate ABC transporter permease [Enterococcus sp. BWB1-3]|uniref:carbohydrate ABC transporter permease n=1 Tax=unclassified Enterococcus TaxID=2608891 RepID=UPI0019213719|nr:MULTISPECIES: carbohydrate ABC transporter permease [unclassified Enterococcus]MBL1230200.1 carbohydrate ABC transporter permease [Enterococcus sp. BWB1-3]MCB5953201.1 carbohydrate ABC transporter permease [Enterococcus sp. BWT-B8]MCB5953757.1 carbohydrate ABC transporter permease [Enterococcus sp. CWB-B31]
MEMSKSRRRINEAIRYVLLIIVGIILIYPLLWMIGSAFKENRDIFGTLTLFPPAGKAVMTNFQEAWQITKENNIWFYFTNTLKFLIPKTIFTVISCTLTAYVIARKSFKGKKFVFGAVIVTLLMPELAFRIPLYLLYRQVGLLDSFASLYVSDIFASSSFFIFMIVQFMRTIPKELDEAAVMDGCNDFQILWRVIVPVIKPILITVALLSFMWGMNDFQGPLIYLNSADKTVLSVVLKQQLDGEAMVNYGRVFAASCLGLLPMIALFFAGSRYFVDGVASTGGKE